MQRYLNLWYSLSLDLFGERDQLQRGGLLRRGPQGPPEGGAVRRPPRARPGRYALEVPSEGRIETQEVPLRNAMNEVMRDAYVEDCQRGVDRWNRAIAAHGVPFELRLPSRRFHRKVGVYAASTPTRRAPSIAAPAWEAGRGAWLPERGRRGVRARA